MLRRKLSLDVPVVNYGIASWFRVQVLDNAIGAPASGTVAPGDPVPPEYYDGSGASGRASATVWSTRTATRGSPATPTPSCTAGPGGLPGPLAPRELATMRLELGPP